MKKFGKQEHLCSEKEITRLFEKGYSEFKYPVKLYWLPGSWTSTETFKVLVTASKRNFKKAVDRNYIKRLLRECFREQKSVFEVQLNGKKALVAFVYTGKEIPEINSLQAIINLLLQRFIQAYEKTDR